MKPLLVAVCIVLALASCQKSATNKSVNTISATIDGMNESFGASVATQMSNAAQASYSVSIAASTGTGTNADALSIFVSSNNKIVTGTYTNIPDSSGNFLQIVYLKGAIGTPVTYNTDYAGTKPSSLTITAISSTSVQGTFSGQLILTNGDSAKTVTDGKFNLKIK